MAFFLSLRMGLGFEEMDIVLEVDYLSGSKR